MEKNELIAYLNDAVPFKKQAGVEIVDISDGRAQGILHEKPTNGNHNGDIAADAMFSLGETIPAAAVLGTLQSEDVFIVVKEVTAQFLAVARGELRASCELDEEARSLLNKFQNGEIKKSDLLTLTEIKDPAGTVVARLKGTYYIRKMSGRLKAKM